MGNTVALSTLSGGDAPSRRRFVDLLGLTTVVVYAVIATGAALASAGTSCSGWPLCGGVDSTTALFALGHQGLTALAGVVLAVTLWAAIRADTSRAVRGLVSLAAVLFPVQVALGAVLATGWVAVPAGIHLLVATAIFGTLLVVLGWTLEGRPSDEADGTGTLEMGGLATEATGATAAPVRRAPETETTAATAETALESAGDGGRGWRATARAYLELTKPRLMWLLCLLALAGIALATMTGVRPDGVTVAATLAGGVLAVGASGTFNHVLEYERDQQMERTADRPLATDRIPRRRATAFGLTLLALAMAVLLALVNTVAALLTLVAVGYYSVLYTVVLKPNTSWNIAIGGGAGALPAVIGWAAVTGSVGLPALVLAGLVVVWTPAHFYNLAIVYRDEYARAGYPMYPVVASIPAARRRILSTLGLTLLAAVLLLVVTPLSWLFALATVAVGAVFLAAFVAQCRTRTDAATLRTFHASNAYLGVVLLAIVAETVVGL